MLNPCGLKGKPLPLLPNLRFMYLHEPYRETTAKLVYFLRVEFTRRTAPPRLYLYAP